MMKSEKVPLVRVQSKHSPQAVAATALKSQDLKSFCNVLDQLEDDGGGVVPLPEDHWINQPFEADGKTFLIFSIEDVPDVEFCRKLVSAGADVNLYDVEMDQAPIHSAVFSESPEKVRALIENPKNRADVNTQIQNSGQGPIHIAAEKGLDDVLDVLLSDEALAPNVDARDSFGGQTPLYLAAKNKKEECVRLLLEKGADLNIRCGKDNFTVRQTIKNNLPQFDLSSPAAYQRPAFVKKTPEDLNKMLETRSLFSFKHGLKFVKPEALSETVVSGMTLMQRSCSEGLPDYVEALLAAGVDPNIGKAKTWRPVLLAASRGHASVLEVLKRQTAAAGKTGQKPVRFDVWTEDSAETVLHLVLKKSLLRAMQGGVGTDGQIKEVETRYYECLSVLLKKDDPHFTRQMRLIVNKRDAMGNTPLHYATTSGWSQSIVRQLLDLGANIGVRNWRDEIPLSRISPQTLSDFLDEECLEASGDLDADDEVQVTFKYSFLAPPVSEDQLAKWDPEQQAELEREALPETNCVWYMSRSPGHRHLVTHPVVTSFLWLKWQRIRRFFNLNLRFYTLFVACLTWYIFARFAGHNWNGRVIHTDADSNDNDSSTSTVEFCSDISAEERGQRYGFWYGAFVFHCVVQIYLVIRDWLKDVGCCISCKCNYSSFCAGWIDLFMVLTMGLVLWGASGILWLALSCLLALMGVRELFQMLSSFRRYLVSVENWIEVTLVALVIVLVHVPDDSIEDGCNAKRCLAAIAILLSWSELITMVGRHPRLSLYNKYVTMFYRVLRSFFSFLIWYAFFLAAFGLGFYIMLHNDIVANGNSTEYVFFDSPGLALVKTSTMFIGELEFSDIPVDRDSSVRAVLGYLFLLAFVFLIVVVLMNLLNGLAVSDTAAIEREAEIICHVSKAETISYAESVLLGDPFDFLADWTTSTKRGYCRMSASCYSAFPAIRNFAQKLTGATGILLFYSYLDEKQVVMPLNPDRFDNDCCYEMGCRRSSKMAEKMRTDTECRTILATARKIIGDRRSKEEQLLNDSKLDDLLRQMLDEQKVLKQLMIKQSEELAIIKKKMG